MSDVWLLFFPFVFVFAIHIHLLITSGQVYSNWDFNAVKGRRSFTVFGQHLFSCEVLCFLNESVKMY